jgi:hypothetical protein
MLHSEIERLNKNDHKELEKVKFEKDEIKRREILQRQKYEERQRVKQQRLIEKQRLEE